MAKLVLIQNSRGELHAPRKPRPATTGHWHGARGRLNAMATAAAAGDPLLPVPPTARTLGIVPVATFIFLSVSGGPYASETAVQAAGPLLVLLGFLLLPFVWGYPLACVTAELASAFPVDSSNTAWIKKALGSQWAFSMSFSSFLGGVIDM